MSLKILRNLGIRMMGSITTTVGIAEPHCSETATRILHMLSEDIDLNITHRESLS